MTLVSMLVLAMLVPAYAFPSDLEYYRGKDTTGVFNTDTQPDLHIKPVKKDRLDKNAALTPPPFGTFGGHIETDFLNNLYPNEANRRSYIDIPKTRYATEAIKVEPKIVHQTLTQDGRPIPKLTPDDPIMTENKTYTTNRGLNANLNGVVTTVLEADKHNKIGTLQIPALNFNLKVFNNSEYNTMLYGVGVINGTSMWDGNVALAGHNRGGYVNVDEFKYLQLGDKIAYTTELGTRNYSVVSNKVISIDEIDVLEQTTHNQLTLITCIAGVPDKRTCVVAIEDLQ